MKINKNKPVEKGGKMTNKKGFTLIELMVVMAIIAVLAVLMVAAIQTAQRTSIETQNRGNAKTIQTAIVAAASRNGGSYCSGALGAGSAPASGGLPRCTASGHTDLSEVVSDLVSGGFLSQAVTGTCVTTNNTYTVGGSNVDYINLAAGSFTINVPGYSGGTCGGSTLQTISQ